ncbi:MAG TPA: hypothetical protein VEL76_13955, partial [Gemmataceae bacterium]|nr:hypothetical protein [Gemmataceae bacterium]
MDERSPTQDRGVSVQGILGYLNFSAGKPDARCQKQIDDAFAALDRGTPQPWLALRDRLRSELAALKAAGTSAFQDTTQAEAVVRLMFDRLLPAYRQHHADLLAHQGEHDLFQSGFLARALEAILAQGGPWDQDDRIVAGALQQLND